MYLDDGFGCHREYDKAFEMSRQVHVDMVSSGFIPKAEKSMWIPCQILEFLGLYMNCELGTIHVPTRRINKISETIQKIQHFVGQNLSIKVRRIASLVGQIISMSLVIGSVFQIMNRSLSIDILSSASWNSIYIYLKKVLVKFCLGKQIIEKINGRDMKCVTGSSRIVYTDASETGYGGFCVQAGNAVSNGVWEGENKWL